jgi:hypothetical protein
MKLPLPEDTESGASAAMAGTVPAVGGVAALELYPQATDDAINPSSNNVRRVFIFVSS